jgi:hypothetical protein
LDRVVIARELARLFQFCDAVAVADRPTMIEKHQMVLTAPAAPFACCPPTAGTGSPPERQRTLGQFCIHLSVISARSQVSKICSCFH